MSEDELLKYKAKNKAARHREDRLKPSNSGGQGRGPRDRLRAASKTPEAVVKVISFAKSKAEVQSIVDYDTRKGEVDLELKDGSIVKGKDEAKDIVDQWSLAFRDRKNARNGMHLAISTPKGTDPEALRRIARAFGQQAFGEGYDYGFVIHTDSANPHAHFVVVRDGQVKNYLGWNRKESQRLRDIMVAEAQKEGVFLNATPRYLRGQIEKGERLPIRKAREREGTSKVDFEAALEVLNELDGKSGENAEEREKWESAIDLKLQEERSEYEGLARAFDNISDSLQGDDKKAADAAARMVRRQAMALRQMDTRRGHMKRLARSTGIDMWPNKKLGAKELAIEYRADRRERAKKEKQITPARSEAVQAKLNLFAVQALSTLNKRALEGDKDAENLRERLDLTKQRERDNDIEQ